MKTNQTRILNKTNQSATNQNKTKTKKNAINQNVTSPQKSNQNKIKPHQTLDETLRSYERLVHKVVRACGIYLANESYDDYCQVARLALYDKLKDNQEESVTTIDENDPTIEETKKENTPDISELFNFLRWRIRDEQRKNQRQQAIAQEKMQQTTAADFIVTVSTENIEWLEFINSFWSELSTNERQYLSLRLINSYSINEIAATCHVSRQSVSAWKRSVRAKFATLQKNF